jgi:hypothetical protein
MPGAASLRRFLRNLLDRELVAVEAREPSKRTQATKHVLDKAIEALYALEQGEVLPIFRPASTTAKGTYPAMLRRCRQQAVTDVAVLNERCGRSIEDAVFEVAEIYDISDSTVHSWRKTFKPLREPPVLIASRTIHRSPNMITFPVSEAGILKAIKVSGDKFKKLRKLTKHKNRKRIKKHKTVQKLKK